MRTRALARLGGLALLTALAGGCATDHLIFTTYTKVGLDITVAEGTPTEAVFGYKRFEGAIVPVNPEEDTTDLSSIYAGICVENSWIQGLEVGQVFATGTAAENMAESAIDSADVKRFLDCHAPSDGN